VSISLSDAIRLIEPTMRVVACAQKVLTVYYRYEGFDAEELDFVIRQLDQAYGELAARTYGWEVPIHSRKAESTPAVPIAGGSL